MKLFRRITVTLIAVCLIVASISAIPVQAKEKRFFPETEHDNIPFEEMSRETTDMEEFRNVVAEIEELLDEENPDAGMLAEKLNAMCEMYISNYHAGELLYYDMLHDTSDTEAGLRRTSCEIITNKIAIELLRLGREALSASTGAELETLLGDLTLEFIVESDIFTDEILRLSDDISALIAEYNSKVNDVFTVNVDGTECTWDDLSALTKSGAITVEEAYQYAALINKQYSSNLEEVYFKLIDKRQEIARAAGYDNYYDFSTKEVYGRDASASQLNAFCNAVKEYIVPLYQKAMNVYYATPGVPDPIYYNTDFEITELTDSFGAYMYELSPELGESFDYMEDMHLLDLVNDGKRLPMSYTMAVAPYKPVIVNGYENFYGAICSCLFHEFGHAAQIYYMNNGSGNEAAIDILEVHSAGLEILGLPYYEKTFSSEMAESIKEYMMLRMTEAAVIGCVIDELEYHIYAEGVESAEDISEYYEKLLREYGCQQDGRSSLSLWNWASTPHIFTNPCYCLSYTVSAVAALELYSMSLENFDDAVDTYLNFCAQGTEKGFTETLKKAGIPNILKPKNVKKLVRKLNKLEKSDAQIAEIDKIYDYKYYVVKQGDTLGGIAKKYGTSVDMLARINQMQDINRIFAGDVIALPGTVHMQEASYTVQKGDTLYEIAKKFGTDLRIIAYRNNIEDIMRIYAGDVLTFEY